MITILLLSSFAVYSIFCQNPVDCKKLTRLVVNSSWIEAEQIVDKAQLKVDWTAAVEPKEAAVCFGEVSLYYGRQPDIKKCCDGFLRSVKTPSNASDATSLDPFVVPVCGDQRLFYLSFKIFNQVKNARLVYNVPPCPVVTPAPTPAPKPMTDDWNFWLIIFGVLMFLIAILVLFCCTCKCAKKKDKSEADGTSESKDEPDNKSVVASADDNLKEEETGKTVEPTKDKEMNDDGKWKGKDLPQEQP